MKVNTLALFAIGLAATLASVGARAATDGQITYDNDSGQDEEDQAAISPNAIGWNSVHASNCYVESSGTLYVYPSEGGWVSTNDPTFISILAPQCAKGNWFAYNVIDSAGHWNALYTYSYK